MPGWFPLASELWREIAAQLPHPWTRDQVEADLAYWRDRVCPEGPRPGRVALARRWGWSAGATFRVLARHAVDASTDTGADATGFPQAPEAGAEAERRWSVAGADPERTRSGNRPEVTVRPTAGGADPERTRSASDQGGGADPERPSRAGGTRDRARAPHPTQHPHTEDPDQIASADADARHAPPTTDLPPPGRPDAAGDADGTTSVERADDTAAPATSAPPSGGGTPSPTTPAIPPASGGDDDRHEPPAPAGTSSPSPDGPSGDRDAGEGRPPPRDDDAIPRWVPPTHVCRPSSRREVYGAVLAIVEQIRQRPPNPAAVTSSAECVVSFWRALDRPPIADLVANVALVARWARESPDDAAARDVRGEGWDGRDRSRAVANICRRRPPASSSGLTWDERLDAARAWRDIGYPTASTPRPKPSRRSADEDPRNAWRADALRAALEDDLDTPPRRKLTPQEEAWARIDAEQAAREAAK